MRSLQLLILIISFCLGSICAADSHDLDIGAVELQSKALQLAKKGEVDEALKLLDNTPQQSNDMSSVLIASTKGEILAKAARHHEAIKVLKPVVDANLPFAWTLGKLLSEECAHAGDFKSAYEYLNSFSQKYTLTGANSEFYRQICELRLAGKNSLETNKQIESLKAAIQSNEKILGINKQADKE